MTNTVTVFSCLCSVTVAAELLLSSARAIYTLGLAVLHSLPGFPCLIWERNK